jgi:glycosyltransferase involved in cell wall biosynthesis
MLGYLPTYLGDDAFAAERVKLVEPRGALPFPDGFFDVTLTCEVLIHVAPDDLKTVLAELLRVTSGRILHIENCLVEETVSDTTAHDGCWRHAFRAAYESLGLTRMKVIPSELNVQDIYEVTLDAEFEMERRLRCEAEAALARQQERLEDVSRSLATQVALREAVDARLGEAQQALGETRQQLHEVIAAVSSLSKTNDRLQRELTLIAGESEARAAQITRLAEALRARGADTEAAWSAHRSEVERAERLQAALDAVAASPGWKLLGKYNQLPLLPSLVRRGRVAASVLRRLRTKKRGSGAGQAGALQTSDGLAAEASTDRPSAAVERNASSSMRPIFSREELRFISQLQDSKSKVVAVHCPRWLGVTSSTRILFGNCYPVPELPEIEPYAYDSANLDHHVEVLLEAGARRLVVSGGDEVHLALVERIRRRDPSVRCDLLWHGSYVQFSEDYGWKVFKMWMDAARAGLVDTIATVKKGMEEFLASVGIRSQLLLNYVPGEPMEAPALPDSRPAVGVWISSASYRKIPHAMLSALCLVPNARLHCAGIDSRAREVASYFDIPIDVAHDKPLSQPQLFEAMRKTHLSLYVTFSECCPMVPLESLSVGVPCLVGPTSHLFEDVPFLAERLIVPYPDRAEFIARFAIRAIAEREEIVREWRRYLPEYVRRAEGALKEFIGDD